MAKRLLSTKDPETMGEGYTKVMTELATHAISWYSLAYNYVEFYFYSETAMCYLDPDLGEWQPMKTDYRLSPLCVTLSVHKRRQFND
jgi:hypothetical protein